MGQLINLEGKKGLIVGIANESSIAYGCGQAFRAAGAELAITYLNAKAERFVRPLGENLDAPIIVPCNVEQEGELEAVFAEIEKQWGKLDFIVHSIAFAPLADLHGRLIDSSREGFLQAMDVSCHSMLRMAKLAEPLMTDGGCILTMSYYGANKAVTNYDLMGPVKAALEASVRYLAMELGEKGIRAHAISPGPLKTRAASGLADFDQLMLKAEQQSAQKRLVTIDDVGALAAFMVSDAAAAITGETLYVDAGYHIVG
ncbi:enoyl-ACP reductase FabI [Candidatus Albibeggiatoa sp. nov. NOAA]|uniref:enoyl-ACP reductase FabI n=1 Tax=Candidatus Albibeggiatoa sp. nov. NOAA TaxID=3162724 RepID=UPI0033037072|nr:enoyl-ACP reductase FabI [Thiotrichaceae bacterium]